MINLRKVIKDNDYIIHVSEDDQNILTNFLIYSLGQVIEGYISFSDFERKFWSNGSGFSIPTLLSAYRIESPEDSYKASWPLSNPEYKLPDYSTKDYWNIVLDPLSIRGMLEIEGDELRRLIREAYQIYLEKGLV